MQEELKVEKTTVSSLPEGTVEGNVCFSLSKARNTDFFHSQLFLHVFRRFFHLFWSIRTQEERKSTLEVLQMRYKAVRPTLPFMGNIPEYSANEWNFRAGTVQVN